MQGLTNLVPVSYTDGPYYNFPESQKIEDRIREFVRNHPTVYCGTHTPQGYENLEAKRVIDLDNPVPTVLAEIDIINSHTPARTSHEAVGGYRQSSSGR